MAAARRHWALVAAIPLLILAILVEILQPGADSRVVRAAGQSVVAQTQPRLSAQNRLQLHAALEMRKHIQQLRAELGLGTQDLAALGVSSATAEKILQAIKTFGTAVPDPLADANVAVQTAKQAFQETLRKINIGPADHSLIASIPTLRQNITAAQSQRDQTLAPLIAQINSVLTPNQQTMWQAVRANIASKKNSGSVPGTSSPSGMLRYVSGLSDDQQQQMRQITQQKGASAASSVLSGMQALQAQTATQNMRSSIAGVVAAERKVFPMPSGLQNMRRPVNSVKALPGNNAAQP